MKNMIKIEELKAIRELRGISIAKVARAIGISPARLARFESKEYRVRDHIMIMNAYEAYLNGKWQEEEILRCHANIRVLNDKLQAETERRRDMQRQVERRDNRLAELIKQMPPRPRLRQVI